MLFHSGGIGAREVSLAPETLVLGGLALPDCVQSIIAGHPPCCLYTERQDWPVLLPGGKAQSRWSADQGSGHLAPAKPASSLGCARCGQPGVWVTLLLSDAHLDENTELHELSSACLLTFMSILK